MKTISRDRVASALVDDFPGARPNLHILLKSRPETFQIFEQGQRFGLTQAAAEAAGFDGTVEVPMEEKEKAPKKPKTASSSSSSSSSQAHGTGSKEQKQWPVYADEQQLPPAPPPQPAAALPPAPAAEAALPLPPEEVPDSRDREAASDPGPQASPLAPPGSGAGVLPLPGDGAAPTKVLGTERGFVGFGMPFRPNGAPPVSIPSSAARVSLPVSQVPASTQLGGGPPAEPGTQRRVVGSAYGRVESEPPKKEEGPPPPTKELGKDRGFIGFAMPFRPGMKR